MPVEQREREGRKAVMKEELVKEVQGKMSGKKKKRLDKYIVRKSHSQYLFGLLNWKLTTWGT